MQQFHEKFVLALTDKAGNNGIIVCRLHCIDTLKSELSTTKTHELISTDEHCNYIVTKFAASINESQEKLPTFYLLPKLHKRPYNTVADR